MCGAYALYDLSRCYTTFIYILMRSLVDILVLPAQMAGWVLRKCGMHGRLPE